MDVRRLRPAIVLSTWTIIVWTTRIRNIWADQELSTGAQVWRTALASAFTAFAAATFAVWVTARRNDGRVSVHATGLVRAFAVWTTVVWIVRGVQIALADHSAAFVAVHTALALVSITLAVWADRSVQASTSDRESAHTG